MFLGNMDLSLRSRFQKENLRVSVMDFLETVPAAGSLQSSVKA
jgi:hypothetical protein